MPLAQPQGQTPEASHTILENVSHGHEAYWIGAVNRGRGKTLCVHCVRSADTWVKILDLRAEGLYLLRFALFAFCSPIRPDQSFHTCCPDDMSVICWSLALSVTPDADAYAGHAV